LFIGDPAQIPPVGEEESAVFFDRSIESYWLTKIERQKDSNPLMDFYDKLRNNLDDLYGGIVRKTCVNENGEGIVFYSDRLDFRRNIIEKFTSNEYKKNSDYAKLIAWTNKAVFASNLLIRSAIFGDDCEMIELDDIMMGYRTISDRTMKFNIIQFNHFTIITKNS
jgi:exodeoxyribonuclease-5